MKAVRVAVSFSAVLAAAMAHAVEIPTVFVGNPGNPPDTRHDPAGYGSVAYQFRIGATEVTNRQYVEFLNAVAASDPYRLYHTTMATASRGGIVRSGAPGAYTYAVKPDAPGFGPGGSPFSYADKPVLYVSWYDAIRFANWLHNGRGAGDTEDGAYTLLGGTHIPANANSVTRNPDARWWLPSEDEWYKAAYYDPHAGVYYEYPTGTNELPNNNLPSADTGNSANFDDGEYTTGYLGYPTTDAGAYKLSASPYGTFDQGGNVAEWNEELIIGTLRSVRGGLYSIDAIYMGAWNRGSGEPWDEGSLIGFRVAGIPEPPTIYLVAVIAVSWLGKRQRAR